MRVDNDAITRFEKEEISLFLKTFLVQKSKYFPPTP